MASCLLALGGCRGNSSQGEAADHAGHVIPAHKPKTFPDAVRRLRELNEQISRKVAEGKAASLIDDKTLPVALDIANWLPEIAADSDMPEKPWNEVNGRSAILVAAYEKLLGDVSTPARVAPNTPVVAGAGKEISGLETLLAAADPRWFAARNKLAAAP